jgi:hypothetical protein
MPDTTATPVAENETPEVHLSVASQRAVDAYRRVITLQHELDDARDEYGRLAPAVPHAEMTAYFDAISAIRDDAHDAKHAAPAAKRQPKAKAAKGDTDAEAE